MEVEAPGQTNTGGRQSEDQGRWPGREDQEKTKRRRALGEADEVAAARSPGETKLQTSCEKAWETTKVHGRGGSSKGDGDEEEAGQAAQQGQTTLWSQEDQRLDPGTLIHNNTPTRDASNANQLGRAEGPNGREFSEASSGLRTARWSEKITDKPPYTEASIWKKQTWEAEPSIHRNNNKAQKIVWPPRSMAPRLKFGTSLGALLFGPFGLSATTRSLTMSNGMKLGSSIAYWDELIMYAKTAWERVLKQIKISKFSAVSMLQGFDKTWGAKNVLCRRHNLHIEWNLKKFNYLK
jgi:hypothetical protein